MSDEIKTLLSDMRRILQRMAVDSAPVAVTKTRAARELEVSSKTIDRMTRNGELKTVTIRGMPRIPFSELLRVTKVTDCQRPSTRVERFNAKAEAQATRLALRRAR